MKLKELEHHVKYEALNTDGSEVVVRAWLGLAGEVRVSSREWAVAHSNLRKRIQDTAREALWRELYELPTRDIYEAVQALMLAVHPTGMDVDFEGAKARLFEAVLRRPPQDCELFGVKPAEALEAMTENNRTLAEENRNLKRLVERFIAWAESTDHVPGRLTKIVIDGKAVLHA